MVTIVQKEDPVLRQIAAHVPVHEIRTAKIKGLIADMKRALSTQDDGVALAAPQIGASVRIFIVSGHVFEMIAGMEPSSDPRVKPKDMVFINPEIVKISRTKKIVEEGCLSVRYLYGRIKRAEKARVRAYNENGELFEMGGSGLLAQIFQHEIDHLEGKLFIDEATHLRDLPPKA